MTIKFSDDNTKKIADEIKKGQVIVLPSDTLYGFSCTATNQNAIEKIYSLKKREQNKPFIILISQVSDLTKFGVNLNNYQKNFLEKHWPGPLSVVFDITNPNLNYLHRGTNSLAFRMPNNKLLLKVISKTGPITSTTVNISGQLPATTINECINYFQDKVSLYVDNGKMQGKPSTVIRLVGNRFELIREGEIKITPKP